ncbi:hypothetical protein HOI26_02770 [Candidatus Woesearchaeota archaeon]|jgi:hypothetical protein|nr:hypothetical protein [Candidatus Woesearchaeota archaeon]MBT5740001.1 hypothetical protein [Candidatus Woesearchaeota archaeon]
MGLIEELSTYKVFELRKFGNERRVKKHILNLLISLKELRKKVKLYPRRFGNKTLLVENLQFCEATFEEFSRGVFLNRLSQKNLIIILSNLSRRLGKISAILTNLPKDGNEEIEALRENIVKHWNKIITISKRYSVVKYEGTRKKYSGIEEKGNIAGIEIVKAA